MAEFNYVPDYGASSDNVARLRMAKFGDGYAQRSADGINHLNKIWSLNFNTRSLSEKNGIVSFLEARYGVIAFSWIDPDGTSALFTCSKWNVIPAGYNTYDIAASFEKVFESTLSAILYPRTITFSHASGGYAGIKIKADGTLDVGIGQPSIVWTLQSGQNWYIKGNLATMRCRWTNTSGTLSVGTADTWQLVSGNPSFQVSQFSAGQTKTCTGLLEIDDGAGIILASATVTLTATDL
jgi:phage-related protein